MKIVTQMEIANRLGVSRSAVAKALHSRLRTQLSPQKRQRILDTAKQLGYVPHHAARRLARVHADSLNDNFDQVGLIYLSNPDIPTAYVDAICLEMMKGAEHELSKLHASLTFVRISEVGDWNKVERLMRAGSVDGWLLYGAANDEAVNRLNPAQLPYVIIGDHRCAQPVHCVTVDYEAMGRLAVQHLAALGHRRIAFFSGGDWFVYQTQTRAGFCAALREFGLDEDERLIGDISSWIGFNWGRASDWERAVQWLREIDPMPTAVFSPEVDWAADLCRSLNQSQLEVPRDISLLSCESVSQASKGQNFTRIELPMAEVGRQGAMLLHKLASERGVKPNEVKIAPSLIEGWSTCPPSNQGPDGETSGSKPKTHF